MLGNIANTGAIIIGSLLGLTIKGGIPERYSEALIKAIGLSVLLIGAKSALEGSEIILIIISMALGTLVGERIQIEKKLEDLGELIRSKFSNSGDGIVTGFVTASLLYCVGSMAIVGSLESGLTGNHETLFAKSVLDGITAIIFTSSLGIGVIFSAAAVFLYQGLIIITAGFMKNLLIESVVVNMSSIGGLLIIGLGLNMLGYKKIKVGNMLPAVIVPILYYGGTLLLKMV
jgi:uncharacterized membrane protein YqgA involved in biofilm formation